MSEQPTRSPLRRLWQPTPEHRSRLHTLRGSTMRGREWFDVPVQLVRRATGSGFSEPWMSRSAIRALAALVQPGWAIAEIGGGASTTWFAPQVASVETFEGNAEWRATIATKLEEAGTRNVTLHEARDDGLADAVDTLDPASVDLLLVDAGEDSQRSTSRVAVVERGRDKVKPGGYLVLDNSDRPLYREVDDLLAGWEVKRFTGPSVQPLTVTETSIYRRPAA